MTNKELRRLANQIADCETIIQNSNDKQEVVEAKEKIVHLTSRIRNLDDFFKLDELIQKIL